MRRFYDIEKIECNGYGYQADKPIVLKNEESIKKFIAALDPISSELIAPTFSSCSCIYKMNPEGIDGDVFEYKAYYNTRILKVEQYNFFFCINEKEGLDEKDFYKVKVPAGMKLRFISNEELESERDFDGETEICSLNMDTLFKEAVKIVIKEQNPTASRLRRRFGIGYPKAMRIVDKMVENGFISEIKDDGYRDIFVTKDKYKEFFGEEFPEE